MYTVSDVIGIILVVVSVLMMAVGIIIAFATTRLTWKEKEKTGLAAILNLISFVGMIAGIVVRFVI